LKGKGAGLAYWLIKTEPGAYAWADLLRDKKTPWTGIRNFLARNNLRAMAKGDLCLVYHSVSEKATVGVARVTKKAYPDPTAPNPKEKGGDWSCVDLAPAFALKRPVTLAQIKADPALQDMALLRQSRLSVCPVQPDEYRRILHLGGIEDVDPRARRPSPRLPKS
jgi:predicted RNA-binding protein with PUA-like domain